MANAGFVGIRFVLEQGFGGYDEAGSADAALQGGVFQESLLYGMQAIGGGYALNGVDLRALGLNAQHQAGGYDAPVQVDGAGAAVAVVAALFGAGHADDVAQAFQQALPRFAEEIGLVAVDGGAYVYKSGHCYSSPRARRMAMFKVRRVRTSTR